MKTNLIQTFAFALFILVGTSCNNKTTQSTEIIDEHTSQNSLDWAGSYSGVTPCADCDGIDTELTIGQDLNYQLITTYLGKGDGKSDTIKGTFVWDGNNIKLEGIEANTRADKFKIEEGRVRSLDMDGNAITGELADNYILKMNGNKNVEDKRWQLTELMGKPVTGTPQTHYLIFHAAEGRLEAKANCNILSYTYKIKNELQLNLEQGISTLMACEDNIEKDLLSVLNEADNLSVTENSLTLNKARMAPLAKFELVEVN